MGDPHQSKRWWQLCMQAMYADGLKESRQHTAPPLHDPSHDTWHPLPEDPIVWQSAMHVPNVASAVTVSSVWSVVAPSTSCGETRSNRRPSITAAPRDESARMSSAVSPHCSRFFISVAPPTFTGVARRSEPWSGAEAIAAGAATSCVSLCGGHVGVGGAGGAGGASTQLYCGSHWVTPCEMHTCPGLQCAAALHANRRHTLVSKRLPSQREQKSMSTVRSKVTRGGHGEYARNPMRSDARRCPITTTATQRISPVIAGHRLQPHKQQRGAQQGPRAWS